MKIIFAVFLALPVFAQTNPSGNVNMYISATDIAVVPEMNKAFIVEPVFNLDKDFGFGKVLLPQAGGFYYIYTYICKTLGYTDVAQIEGDRPNKGAYSVNIRDGELTIEKTAAVTVPKIVVCQIK